MTPEAGPRRDGLDRGRDVLDVVAGHRRRDPGQHRLAGQIDQLGDFGRRFADVEGPGGITMPAIDDRAGIDRHDLARRIVRSPGIPWTISSSTEMHTLAGNGRLGFTPG